MRLHSIRKSATGYADWGCMWKKGELPQEWTKGADGADGVLCCKNRNGQEVPMQSRVTAYWQDGSVKWTAHTADAGLLQEGMEVTLRGDAGARAGRKTENGTGEPAVGNSEMRALQPIDRTAAQWEIAGEKMTVRVTPDSDCLFDEVLVDGTVVLRQAKAVLKMQQPTEVGGNPAIITRDYEGRVGHTVIEEEGPLQTVIKFEGIHICCNGKEAGEKKIPFVIRMYVAKTLSDIRFVHTFLYDGEEDRDFLKGLGICMKMPLHGALYNRHIKFAGDHGVFHEESVLLLSWRPRIPEALYERQTAGERVELTEEERYITEQILPNAPHWDTYALCQDSAEHFRIHKKLAEENCCFIDSLSGHRTEGGCAFGSEGGSILMGIRDFWEKYPSGMEVRGLSGEEADAFLWFYSPEAESYDFRHYANRGYNQVCYEGYEYKGADPVGIACTNECAIRLTKELIPSDEELTDFSAGINKPPLYVANPEWYHKMGAFGCWSLVQNNSAVEQWMEEQLARAFAFYRDEVEQRGWYGMFNYGDFMHTYDAKRHQWKYDVGGYAWDNTELVPTLWLWLYFLRTGREDVFTLAEKLSRHASEVDVYHFGKYKGLGSRHNVRHWGCPCKEARIAMAAHHRVLYYLTGDRRLSDIFEELKDNEQSFLNRDPLGDFFPKEEMVYESHARSGPDWSSLCSNWMTEWERTGDTKYRDKIMIGLSDIKKAPLKLSSGPDFEFDPKTVHLRYIGERTTGGCHLQVCMGAPLVWMEAAELLEDEEFKQMIADHGRLSFMTKEERTAATKGLMKDREYAYLFMFSAMGAYGAWYYKDKALAKKVWRTLFASLFSDNGEGFTPQCVANAGNQAELLEIPWISTNFTAQWCLNVMMAENLIGAELPKDFTEVEELLKNNNGEDLHRA